VETLKLDNQVAVPLVRLEPPTAAATVGPPPVIPPLPKDAALRHGLLLLSYGVADEEETTLYFSPDCHPHRPLRRRVHASRSHSVDI